MDSYETYIICDLPPCSGRAIFKKKSLFDLHKSKAHHDYKAIQHERTERYECHDGTCAGNVFFLTWDLFTQHVNDTHRTSLTTRENQQ